MITTAPAQVERDQHLADIIRQVERMAHVPHLTHWDMGKAADGAPWLTARMPDEDPAVTQHRMQQIANQPLGPRRHTALDVAGPAMALEFRVCCAWISLRARDTTTAPTAA